MSHTRSGGGDAVLGTLLAHVSHPAAADGLLLQGGAVEAEALVGFGPLVQRHALEADAGPGRELLAAVLTQHVAGDGLVVDAGLPRQCAQQAGGVQTGAGAEHPAAGQPQMQRQFPRNDVAGVRDVDEHAVKAGCLDFCRVTADGGNGEIHLGQPVVRLAQKLNFADAVDNYVALAKVCEIARANRHPVRKIRRCVAEVLYLTCQLLLVFVDQHQLVRNALYREGVGDVRAHMAKADDTKNSFLTHI